MMTVVSDHTGPGLTVPGSGFSEDTTGKDGTGQGGTRARRPEKTWLLGRKEK